jgi:hypothetical protein
MDREGFLGWASEKGAFIAGGVYDHLGLPSVASAPASAVWTSGTKAEALESSGMVVLGLRAAPEEEW